MTNGDRHVLGLIANRLCFSLLDDRHPAVVNLTAKGMITKTTEGLILTERGLTALGTTWTDGTRAMDTGRAGR